MITLKILLWTGLFGIFYTYLFYPKVLQFLVRNKKLEYNKIPFADLPRVSVVMAVYNEEKVIEQKVRSVFNGNYPARLIDFYIGSDCSNDKTNTILTELKKEYPTLNIQLFTERKGKINIINHFLKEVPNDIVISTDANNIFLENTIYELVCALLSDENIGIVDTHIIRSNINKFANSIGKEELFYLNNETKTKLAESILFGVIAVPSGGCFAIKKKLWKEVPATFLADDFYVGISVAKQGYKTITNLNAKTLEDINTNPKVEYRRKIRIGTGNFQNFFCQPSIFLNLFTKIGFVMFSHKLLRWFTSFILIFVLIATIYLAFSSIFYTLLLGLEVLTILLCISDLLLRKFSIQLPLIRFISHFYTSNICLLIGFIRCIRGVKTSIWSPTERFQKAK